MGQRGAIQSKFIDGVCWGELYLAHNSSLQVHILDNSGSNVYSKVPGECPQCHLFSPSANPFLSLGGGLGIHLEASHNLAFSDLGSHGLGI